MDFRKDAPLFFDSRTRPRPVSVEVSEIRFAKPPYYSQTFRFVFTSSSCKRGLKLPLRVSWSHFECLCRHSYFTSPCIVDAVKFNVTPTQNFVSPLWESSPRKALKKIQCRRTTVSSSKRTFGNQSKFIFPCTLTVRQIENEQESTVGEVSQLRNQAAGGHCASLSSG